METIYVGLSSWIIQDGNYPDFAVGDERQFALEFYAPKKLRRSSSKDRAFVHQDAEEYEVSATVAFAAADVWVVDAGILLFREETPPRNAQVGTLVKGRIRVGVDPFFYKEYLHTRPGIPKLCYGFQIQEILLDTTPWKKRGRVMYRRPGERVFKSIEKTDAWHDDDGNAEYVLKCRRLSGAA